MKNASRRTAPGGDPGGGPRDWARRRETGYGWRMTAGPAPYQITPAARPTALVFASPHSGDAYPDDMGAAPGLSVASLRSAEDALVDRLVAAGPAQGAPLIAGRVGRAYIDLNRAPDELDPALIDGCGETAASPRAAAGYGVAPRLAGDGTPLYARRPTLAEIEGRLARVHAPYHAGLADLMTETRAREGVAVLIDWHSMPARATPSGARGADVVLGDRHGSSCGVRLTRRLRDLFEGLGWRTALNVPYAGGYSTRLWGRPEDGFHAVQIELSRTLYLDETRGTPGPGYDRCRKGVERVIAALAAEDWRGL